MFDFDLDSVLEESTVQRSEFVQDVPMSDFSALEFDPAPEDDDDDDDESEIDLLPYDAEESAELLIDLIDTINTASLTPLARWKLTKKRGGKAEIRKMQEIAAKNFNGEELTQKEQRTLNQYQAYLKDKEELENAIPYTEEEKDRLRRSAIPYLRKTKIKIGGGMTFWTELAVIQGSRIMQVLSA